MPPAAPSARSPKAWVTSWADPARLAQIVRNLLSNASKFADRGGCVWLTVEGDAPDVVIRVRDRGIGIAAEQCPRIFEMFGQVDSSLE